MPDKTLSHHRIAIPELKILLVLGVVILGLALPVSYWPGHICLISLCFIMQSLQDVSLSYLLRRLALFLPVVFLFSLSIPFTENFERGWDISLLILLRSLLAFMAMLWLIHSMSFEELLVSLRNLYFPPLLLMIIAFMFRYCFILWEELERMRTSRRSRTFQKPGLIQNWIQSAQLIGMLLIRSLKRSERIHQAMCSRGWNGEIRFLDKSGRS